MTTMQATLTNTPADPTQTTINLTIVDKNGNPTTLPTSGQNTGSGPTIKTIPITLQNDNIDPGRSHLQCRQIGDTVILSGQITTNKEIPENESIDIDTKDLPIGYPYPTILTTAAANATNIITNTIAVTIHSSGLTIKTIGTNPTPPANIPINTTYITKTQ